MLREDIRQPVTDQNLEVALVASWSTSSGSLSTLHGFETQTICGSVEPQFAQSHYDIANLVSSHLSENNEI